MHTLDTHNRKPPAGFTLLELMMAMTIGSVVVAGGLTMFLWQQKLERANSIRLEVHGTARYALDQVTRDALEAGEGLDPTAVFGVLTTGDGNTGPDTLYILRADPDTPIHMALDPVNDPKTELIIDILCDDPVDDLGPGDVVYLASGSARGVASIVSVTRNATGSKCTPGNTPELGEVVFGVSAIDGEGHGWPFSGNSGGAAVLRVDPAVYFLDESFVSNPKLIRATRYISGAWVGAPIAEMITGFQVRLAFSDGTIAAEADATDSNPDNDYNDVNTAHIEYTSTASRADRNLNGGKLYRRAYSMRVTPRNPLYSRNLE